MISGNFFVFEDGDLPGPYSSCTKKQFYGLLPTYTLKIDDFIEQVPHRVYVKRIKVIRRYKATDHVDEQIAG